MAWCGSGVRTPSAPESSCRSEALSDPSLMVAVQLGEPLWEPSCRLPVWLGLHAVATAKTASISITRGTAGTALTTTVGTAYESHNLRRDFRRVTAAAGLGARWVPKELRTSSVIRSVER